MSSHSNSSHAANRLLSSHVEFAKSHYKRSVNAPSVYGCNSFNITMPGTKKNHPPCPAEWVGGRRRKLVRRNRTSGGPPRSSTMPALMAESATDSLVSSVSTVGSGYVRDRQSEDGHDQQQREMGQQPEGFEDKMHFYPPSGAVKYVHPNNQGRADSDMSRSDAHASFADGPATASPKLTATDSRKKQSLFGTKKPKALDRPNSSTHSLGVVSPLPVSTPSKAAQFFGIEPKPKPLGSPRRGQLRDDGISGDDALVRLTPQKQRSLPLLTKFKLGADRQIRFREEDNEPLSRSSKNSKFNANKGLRMLIPDFAGSRRAPIQQTTAEATRFDVDDDDGDAGYGSDSSPQEARFQIPSSSRPVPAPMKRRPNKKHPKPLESMSPIPEASFESLRPAYRQSEDLTELGVISEYESDSPAYSAPLLPRSHTESVLPSYNTFELDEEDLSPTDRFYYEGPTDDEDDTVHPGTKVDLKRAHSQQRTRLHIRSPLQSIEDNYLDATEDEMRLAARKMTLDRIEKDKQAMDAEIAVLRREHEKLKLGFSNITTHNEVDPMPGVHSDGDNEDLMSLRSSIDSDEEPTVHEAQVMTFTRITPGMVKLVDIRARKNPMAHAASNTPVSNKLPPVRHETKDFAAPALDENLPPVSVSYSMYCRRPNH